jgi:hypothetical protein
MKYLLFICVSDIADPDQAAAAHEAVQAGMPAWFDEVQRRGVRKLGHALAEPSTATTVRVRNGDTLLTDGPFAETKDFIGGFDILECRDLDEAIEIAALHPMSWYHSVEVRPFAASETGD